MIATVPRFIASKTEPLREVADFWIDISDNKPVIKYWNGEWFPVIVESNIDLTQEDIAKLKGLPTKEAIYTEIAAVQNAISDIAEGKVVPIVTTTSAGLMSAEDKVFLDSLKTAAQGL